MISFSKYLSAMIVVAAAIAGPAAAASNLVTNPGFETGDFTDWSVNASDPYHTIVNPGIEGPHTGYYAAFFGQSGSLASVSQTIATTRGEAYTFSFYFASQGGTPSRFEAFFGNTKLLDIKNAEASGYILESFTVAATSASTTIKFSGRDDLNYLALDDVSVTAENVPEPATLAILGSTLFGLGVLRRRTRG